MVVDIAVPDDQVLRIIRGPISGQRRLILAFDEVAQFVADLGESRYRAQQIWEWIYGRHAAGFGEMTNLSKSLRQKLAQTATIAPLVPVTEIAPLVELRSTAIPAGIVTSKSAP